MQWLSKALTKGPDLKADILDAGVDLKGSKISWKLHEGKRKDNGAAVSILAFEITASTSDIEISCARNALHRFKTIRHPHVLLYIDGYEPPEGAKSGKVLIVVDHVKPLEQVLAQSASTQEKEACVWGLWTVVQAMHFINADCRLQHGNICIPSIFVSDSGDWKLGGFELMSESNQNKPFLASACSRMLFESELTQRRRRGRRARRRAVPPRRRHPPDPRHAARGGARPGCAQQARPPARPPARPHTRTLIHTLARRRACPKP